jgi:GNAT superfamily N-acetyltransferase
MAPIDVRPASPARWSDVAEVFGTRGDPSWCWCQFFLTTGNGYTESAPRNRRALRRQIQGAATAPGLVAYVDDQPAGWLQLGPRDRFPRVVGNRAAAEALGDEAATEDVWRTTCFVVKVGRRRQGVAGALLDASIAFAREHGASALEGHPVDVAAVAGKPASANLYHGALSTFLRAGFLEIGRTAPHRPIVRLTLG